MELLKLSFRKTCSRLGLLSNPWIIGGWTPRLGSVLDFYNLAHHGSNVSLFSLHMRIFNHWAGFAGKLLSHRLILNYILAMLSVLILNRACFWSIFYTIDIHSIVLYDLHLLIDSILNQIFFPGHLKSFDQHRSILLHAWTKIERGRWLRWTFFFLRHLILWRHLPFRCWMPQLQLNLGFLRNILFEQWRQVLELSQVLGSNSGYLIDDVCLALNYHIA